ALRFLKGMSAEELDQKATAFYSDFLIERSNAQVFQQIKKPGVTTILLSSSINPVIQAIAKANNFAYFSSEMEMKNGIATGNLQTDMTGRKHVVAKRLITEQAVTNFGVITDNHSDWELVKLAHDRWIVISTEEQKHFWKLLHPNFILIS
ncbi:MAG: haloacid dehalogenase-like hydrolase, partial [Cyclobacteriaceae bacterium]